MVGLAGRGTDRGPCSLHVLLHGSVHPVQEWSPTVTGLSASVLDSISLAHPQSTYPKPVQLLSPQCGSDWDPALPTSHAGNLQSFLLPPLHGPADSTPKPLLLLLCHPGCPLSG